ncbi:hypothetical protein [Desulfovibrio psychrotolerans]|uniref:Uncharacterized protein n=1 Tax=Desulfovibrio psychrotolerans TaxID=415242 RepID=A0A7J0BW51_9BACT|nr:hypothetical protein [Desulfovibrio psychrotolerans]GFM37939.1 hypothetical protein DSM19430T_26230 [Desulfovibrio psychrotolerans]
MDFSSLLQMVDPVLIAPYRWLEPAEAGFWLGTAILSLWILLVGEIFLSLVYLCNRRHYASLSTKMVHMHNLSVEAIVSKDKASYKATNKFANDYFGKYFFSQAALFSVSILPLPFAMAWLQSRFEGIAVHTVPYFDKPLGYTFVVLACYIPLRYGLSRIRQHIPLLRRVARMRTEDAKAIEPMRHWSDLFGQKPTDTNEVTNGAAHPETGTETPAAVAETARLCADEQASAGATDKRDRKNTAMAPVPESAGGTA